MQLQQTKIALYLLVLFLKLKKTKVTMVATDTHRMAVKKITIDEPATTPMRANHSYKNVIWSISFVTNR